MIRGLEENSIDWWNQRVHLMARVLREFFLLMCAKTFGATEACGQGH